MCGNCAMTPTTPCDRPVTYRRAPITARESEVLTAWLRSGSKAAVAAQLYISEDHRAKTSRKGTEKSTPRLAGPQIRSRRC